MGGGGGRRNHTIVHSLIFPLIYKQSEKAEKQHCVIPQETKQTKNSRFSKCAVMLLLKYDSMYLKTLPKGKPHDPWDSRQYVRTDVSALVAHYDLENMKKKKKKHLNLTSSHPDLRRGTQVRVNVALIAAEAEPGGLHEMCEQSGTLKWEGREHTKPSTVQTPTISCPWKPTYKN